MIEAETLLYETLSAIDDLGSSFNFNDCVVLELVGEYPDVHRLDLYSFDLYSLAAFLDPPFFVDYGIVQH